GAGFAEFLVSDTGTGISAEDAPHIFERGYTTGEGKGIGLSICLETIRMHGGSIELAASGPDGTTFRFTVPKEKE
ncbi:MAG: HAMP domain-containing histidine kinase, partial [Lachnospiraceae bacterium]|nr:HAMP domain-containing histidine kinase [Lachnospiraceae bacterium]